jgi:methyl-accepting chemotaxis protein
MRQQAEQAAKALKEQARAMKDMSGAATNTANQIKTITRSNRDHSQAAAAVAAELTETRRISERNVSGVKQTRTTTADLLRHAEALTAVVDDPRTPGNGSNGRPARTNGH